MIKSLWMRVGVASLLAGVLTVVSLPSREAAAQSSRGYINTVDLDIVPDQMGKFIELARENGASSIKEPGCREFNISVLDGNPNRVFVYEVYDDDAALRAHLNSDHFKKFIAATANMITGRNVRAMSPIAFNSKSR
jgi:quinol monooxygenase YgiN